MREYEIMKLWNYEIMKLWNYEIMKLWNYDIDWKGNSWYNDDNGEGLLPINLRTYHQNVYQSSLQTILFVTRIINY